MSEEEIKEIAREEMLDTIKSKLDSSMIFTYINNLEQENKQLKEKIDKAIEYIKENEFYLDYKTGACIKGVIPLLEILGDKE